MLGFGSLGQFSLGEADLPDVYYILTGATGTGVARSQTSQVSAILTGGAGTGTAGLLGRFNVTLTMPQAAGVGTAGSLIAGVSVQVPNVAGIGTTNWVPRAFEPYTFVELVHFDAYPVSFQTGDMVSISVTVPSAVAGGVAGQIKPTISGGGTSADGSRKRDSRLKSGLERVRKHPQEPPAAAPASPTIPLPPYKGAPALVPTDSPPPNLVDRDLIPPVLALQDQIYTAQDISDIQRYLRGLDQDEQDARDIADILAILD